MRTGGGLHIYIGDAEILLFTRKHNKENTMGEAIVRKLRLATCALFCLTLISTASWAQQDGTINGKISDSSGAVLPGVGITISSLQLRVDSGHSFPMNKATTVQGCCRREPIP